MAKTDYCSHYPIVEQNYANEKKYKGRLMHFKVLNRSASCSKGVPSSLDWKLIEVKAMGKCLRECSTP
jgi:hypothetical protein